MKYSLDLYIINNNQGILNAVKNLLPVKEDARVWSGEYSLHEDITKDGDSYLIAMIRFYDVAERTGSLNSIKGLSGVLSQCLPGSYIRTHKCYHKWNQENPRNQKGCEIENMEVP